MDKHFHYVVPVWGEKYTNLFIDVSLPMLLRYSGLGELQNPNDTFVILTTWHDRCLIVNSLIYPQLQKIAKIHFVLIDGLVDFDNPYQAMSDCYAIAMRNDSVVPEKTFFVFLTPDSFWSQGMFRRLIQLRDEKYKVAMAIGIRMNLETFSPILIDLINKNNESINIPSEDLAKYVIGHMHPMAKTCDLLSRDGFINQWPSNLFWINSDENQLIAHCFHLHPVMVQAPTKKIKIGDTLDGKMIQNLKFSSNDFYVFQEGYYGLELTSGLREWNVKLSSPSINKIIDFAIMHASNMHFHFFKQRLIIGNQAKIDSALDELITKTVDAVSAARGNRFHAFLYYIVQSSKRKCKNAIMKFAKALIGIKNRLMKGQERVVAK